MSDYPDESAAPHPDSILRLASAVHRFSIPYINPEDQLSFEDSFKSCSKSHQSTLAVMRLADSHRQAIKKSMADQNVSHASLSKALREYIPVINQILLSCKFQPEAARLDKRLLFSWCSGLEVNKNKKKPNFDSEALMFELVLSVATYALSESNVGCDSCVDGDFPHASRKFASAAGVFRLLGDDLLPNWMANSKQVADMEGEALAETRVGVCVAFASLYSAMAQQMAVATVLVRPGVPNYALVGKLCAGVAEDLESFVSTLRSKSSAHMQRMDPSFLKLIAFSINVHRAVSLYFLARSLWTACDYGVAIAAMSEATVAMRTRTSPTGRGLPEVEEKGPLSSLVGEMNGFRVHMASMLRSWEKDNSLVYFDKVPPSVPASKALKAIQLNKAEEFALEMRDPLPLGPKGASFAKSNDSGGDAPPSYDNAMDQKTDDELARELDAKLNTSRY